MPQPAYLMLIGLVQDALKLSFSQNGITPLAGSCLSKHVLGCR
jgi:hypothetical protein